jgi:hypothetical protein
LNVIAQELRDYASRVVQGIRGLPAALQEVISFVERFSEAGSAHNAIHLTALGDRMTAAIGSFESSGAGMSSALTKLDEEAEGVCGNLKEAVARLRSHEEIAAALSRAVESLEGLGEQICDQSGADIQSGAVLDKLLRGKYTMASERQIHDAFTGNVGGTGLYEPMAARSDDIENDLEGEELLAEACLF